MSSIILIVPIFLAQADIDGKTVRAAIAKGIERIEQGAKNYPKNRQCFSCHHQAVPMLALHVAKERGLAVDGKLLQDQIDFTLKSFASKKGVDKGQGIGGASTTVGYAMLALAAAQHPSDDTILSLVQFLLARQNKDGSWTAQAQRLPSEGSPFTSTALALFGLNRYAPIDAELRKRVEAARSRGRAWLLDNEPKSTEDRVFQLRGLLALDGTEADIEEARGQLLKQQLEDGSWPQLADMKGDAYATGSALAALRAAGLPANHPAYINGVRYLLATQTPDGAWLVDTRSRPIQTFFDNGDAGGASQFISFAATSWATLALLETLPVAKK